MARKGIKGGFAGEYQEGNEQPEELNREIELVGDPEEKKTTIGSGKQRTEYSGFRLATAAAFIVSDLARKEHAKAHANRPISSNFKDTKTRKQPRGVPSGFVICPDCSNGIDDYWECVKCDGRGIIRLALDDPSLDTPLECP